MPRLWFNCHAATLRGGRYAIIEDAALLVEDGWIKWIGRYCDAPAVKAQRVDLGGGWITPGLIDCHTHAVFGGNRSDEFERRLEGESYASIAASGGGIMSTVRATRAASEEALYMAASARLELLAREGVTTVEIKSGYGLELDSERRMLRVARRLGAQGALRVTTTLLAAHTLPPEFAGNTDGYIDEICTRMLPTLAAEGLIDAVDAFCEHLAFTPAQVRRLFACARSLGLPVKLHAEQLSHQGGARLAAECAALSADHLEYANADDARAMAAAGSVAVLLPGAYHLLRETQAPPVAALRRHGVAMALASDLNPGTSPALSLRLMMNFGCTLYGLTAEEALAGVTLHAARALGLDAELGSLESGKRADFVHWRIDRPADLAYWLGGELPVTRVVGGEPRDGRCFT